MPPDLQAREEETEPGQPEASLVDEIVICCHARNVENLVGSLRSEIKHAPEALPMAVLWSGESCVLHQGVIVLEWQGPLNPAFLQSLSIDHEIFDYVVFAWISDGRTDQEGEEDLTNQGQGSKGTQQSKESIPRKSGGRERDPL